MSGVGKKGTIVGGLNKFGWGACVSVWFGEGKEDDVGLVLRRREMGRGGFMRRSGSVGILV